MLQYVRCCGKSLNGESVAIVIGNQQVTYAADVAAYLLAEIPRLLLLLLSLLLQLLLLHLPLLCFCFL